MERLSLDTNVLFPMTLMDLLLAMAEDFHNDRLWSGFRLDDWEWVIVCEQRRTPEQASAITSAIRHAFPSGRIASDDYASIIETVPGPDPDDRVTGRFSKIPPDKGIYPSPRMARAPIAAAASSSPGSTCW